MSSPRRVLSVQSHVVHGYVGNRAATFPLQVLGWDVDVLNSVQFSNHTGYGSWSGTKTTAQQLDEIYAKLVERGFPYDAFLTGYVPSADAVEAVGRIGADLKERFPRAIWVLDPVLGDNGTLYVAEECIPIYKSILKTGKVDLITPNKFEAELLCGMKINSREDITKALHILHDTYKVKNVVISSLEMPGSSELIAVGSQDGGKPFFYRFDAIDSYFTGTGDLFAALMLAKTQLYASHERYLEKAVKEALEIMNGVLLKTTQNSAANGVNGGKGVKDDPIAMMACELQVVASRDIFMGTEDPGANYKVKYFE
ncbi:putative pyridoxal kinase Bud16p [Trichomonascus vanleenenianus]|uniref:pyridoxal kinase n=1 Tax=Trichomonascus vanleenenianus TaxID=2268995 RepID=UPI003EC9B6D1